MEFRASSFGWGYFLSLPRFMLLTSPTFGLPRWLSGKESACQCKRLNMGSIAGSGSSPGGGHGNPLQCSCLEDPVDRGAWWATVYRVTKRWTRLSDWAGTHLHFIVVSLTSAWNFLFILEQGRTFVSNTVPLTLDTGVKTSRHVPLIKIVPDSNSQPLIMKYGISQMNSSNFQFILLLLSYYPLPSRTKSVRECDLIPKVSDILETVFPQLCNFTEKDSEVPWHAWPRSNIWARLELTLEARNQTLSGQFPWYDVGLWQGPTLCYVVPIEWQGVI